MQDQIYAKFEAAPIVCRGPLELYSIPLIFFSYLYLEEISEPSFLSLINC